MSLSDRLKDTPQRIHGKPCSIGQLEDTLTGDELAALQSMLHELGWSATRIYGALLAEGHSVGAQSINRHRARSCRCFKAVA